MSNTIANENKSVKTLFHANPVLSRMSKVTERVSSDGASYAGIAAKTSFFLLVTLAGMIAQLLVKNMMANEPIWQTFTIYKKFTVALTMKETAILGGVLVVGLICEFVGIFARRTVPVTGTIYSASQGYLISFIVFKVLTGYEHLGLEALLLTVAVVLVMSWLYSSGLVRGGKKFRAVLLGLLLGSVCFGILTFLGTLIPATRPFVQTLMGNPTVTIIIDVVGLLIAAMFLISDFSMIENCVQEGYPKDYEWSAAFGLVFTVLWIYLKILDLLMQFSGDKNK